MRRKVTFGSHLAKKLTDMIRRRGPTVAASDDLDTAQRAPEKDGQASSIEPYTVEAHRGGFRQAIDTRKLNQLVDQMDVRDFAGEIGPATPQSDS